MGRPCVPGGAEDQMGPVGGQDAVIVSERILGDVHLPLGGDLEEVDLRVLVQIALGVDEPPAISRVL